jgi:hypothetical protein
MRIIVIAAVFLLCPPVALADGGGAVKAPAVGTAAPPASDLGGPPKTVPGGTGSSVPVGTDTSTAAPGGKAESSRNGALSGPNTERDAASRDHPKPVRPEDTSK